MSTYNVTTLWGNISNEQWTILINTAWNHDPILAVNLLYRFKSKSLYKILRDLILKNPFDIIDCPGALNILFDNNFSNDITFQLKYLGFWAPVVPLTAITYFLPTYNYNGLILQYAARNNFVQSMAAYSVITYILQIKDRHNGNIMIDKEGHIVHIDFGFLLDIAPGGIAFESAPFKLTREMIAVMGGNQKTQSFIWFQELCIKAFFACRPYAENIIECVTLMLDSGLPCFKGASTINNLRSRFHLDQEDHEAARIMIKLINNSYENKRTIIYDQFQAITN
ncbi:hypothetical protein PCK2_000779, partial [Pneumocystis canis]